METRYETSTASETPEQIIEHINRLMAEAEAMLAGPVAEHGNPKLSELRARLTQARGRLSQVYGKARQGVVAGARYTDQTIRDYPYYALGIAVGAGVLAGMLLGRSQKR